MGPNCGHSLGTTGQSRRRHSMATLRRITVSTAAGFNPAKLQALVGDAVVWYNDDATAGHQPFGTGATAGALVPLITGQNSSNQYNLKTAGTIPYQDALNQALTGSIVVSSLVQIGTVFGGGSAAFVPAPPATLTIPAGTTVVWQNSDARPHQPAPVGGPATAWFAQPIPAGEYSAPVTFNTKGVINYADALNVKMTGSITV